MPSYDLIHKDKQNLHESNNWVAKTDHPYVPKQIENNTSSLSMYSYWTNGNPMLMDILIVSFWETSFSLVVYLLRNRRFSAIAWGIRVWWVKSAFYKTKNDPIYPCNKYQTLFFRELYWSFRRYCTADSSCRFLRRSRSRARKEALVDLTSNF